MRRNNQFGVEISKPTARPIEESLYYWYPQRFGVKTAPEDFQRRVAEIHPDLAITWHPLLSRWLVWYKRPRITDPKCPGWMLLFVAETSWGSYVGLDERVLAAIYQVSARAFGNGVQYFDRLAAEAKRDRESAARLKEDQRDALAYERFDWGKIKNIGPGSKFANYHS